MMINKKIRENWKIFEIHGNSYWFILTFIFLWDDFDGLLIFIFPWFFKLFFLSNVLIFWFKMLNLVVLL